MGVAWTKIMDHGRKLLSTHLVRKRAIFTYEVALWKKMALWKAPIHGAVEGSGALESAIT